MPTTTIWWHDNDMLVILDELTDENDGSEINSGVTVEAEIFDEDDVSLHTASLAAEGTGGKWQVEVDNTDVAGISIGDRIRVQFTVSSGADTIATWNAYPVVSERKV